MWAWTNSASVQSLTLSLRGLRIGGLLRGVGGLGVVPVQVLVQVGVRDQAVLAGDQRVTQKPLDLPAQGALVRPGYCLDAVPEFVRDADSEGCHVTTMNRSGYSVKRFVTSPSSGVISDRIGSWTATGASPS